MSSPGFLWFTPRRLGAVNFLLLVIWVSGTVQNSVLFDTQNRGTTVLPDKPGYVNTSKSFKFADTVYNSIGVSVHGLIYFGEERTFDFSDDGMPIKDIVLIDDIAAVYPMLQRNTLDDAFSKVTYLEISAAESDELATTLNNALADFLPDPFVEWLFVVTWNNVLSRSSSTFQVVLAVTGEKTYVVLNYVSTAGSIYRAEGGLFDGNSRTSYIFPGTGIVLFKRSILRDSSNAGVPGRWIYDVTNFLPGVKDIGIPRTRLVGGSTEAEGRLEVLYQGRWGTVCNHRWDQTATDVTCRSLGFQYGVSSNKYGGGSGSIVLEPFECTGNESSIASCPNYGPLRHDCMHDEDVGISCYVPCEPNPCKNGGTCEGERCTCPIGKGGVTCEDDLSYVRCDSTSMTVVIDIRLLPTNSDASDVHFRSQAEDCVATVSNSTHIKMVTGYDHCDTTTEEDEDNIIFQNVITFAKPGADDGAIITREYHQQILVECCLNKTSIVTGNFKPQIGKIDINDKEHGKFSLKITRFTNDEFDTEENVVEGVVADGQVMLGTKLYFGVVLDSTSVVGVVIKDCWATEEGPAQHGPANKPKEDLIKDQCPAEDTVTVNRALPLYREGFSFDAFRFINEISGVTEIYVYCDVVVCKSDEAEAARADVVCGEAEPSRRRRDVSSGTRHTVIYGPLNIYSLDASYAASSKESHGIFGTRVYVIGIVALVSMVTIWGVVKGCSFKIKDHEAKQALLVNIN